MNDAPSRSGARDIVVEEVLPHAPETIWRTLTSGELMNRWLHMNPIGFVAVEGTRFTLQTRAAGAWDGVIHCEILEVMRHQRLSYSWRGGHESNAQYGSLLDTVVTWTLVKAEGGTRLRLVHSGFVTPRNETSFKNLSDGWKQVVGNVGNIAGELMRSNATHDAGE